MDNLELINRYNEYLKRIPAIQCGHKKYYIIWLEKLLMFAENTGAEKIDFSIIEAFLKSLAGNPGLQSWQIHQASDAIAYFIEMAG